MDWITDAKPVSCEAVIDAAIDGGDWQMAAMALLALPRSRALPTIVAEDLGRIAFDQWYDAVRAERVVRTVASHFDRDGASAHG